MAPITWTSTWKVGMSGRRRMRQSAEEGCRAYVSSVGHIEEE